MSAATTLTVEDQLRKQNAMLLRTLVRLKGERDELLKQIAALTASSPEAQLEPETR